MIEILKLRFSKIPKLSFFLKTKKKKLNFGFLEKNKMEGKFREEIKRGKNKGQQ